MLDFSRGDVVACFKKIDYLISFEIIRNCIGVKESVNLLTNEGLFVSFVIRQQLNSAFEHGWSGEGCLWVC